MEFSKFYSCYKCVASDYISEELSLTKLKQFFTVWTNIFITINVTPIQFVFNLDPENVNFVEERSTVDQEK